MGITTAAASRTPDLRAEANPESASPRFNNGSAAIERGLAELKHALVIETRELHTAPLDLRLKHALIGGES